MDPSSAEERPDMSWLPRLRGDGPSEVSVMPRSSPVAPPTRGWTGRTGGHYLQCMRLPRLRGDGPKARASRVSPRRVAPPTRGWTLDIPHRQSGSTGCPAYAGMDLKGQIGGGNGIWLPRLRGDGPSAPVRLVNADKVAPPTRGWTP